MSFAITWKTGPPFLREAGPKLFPIMLQSKDKNCFSGKKIPAQSAIFLPKPVIPEVLYKLMDNLMRNTLYDQHYRFPMVCEESRFDLGIDKNFICRG